jgi:5-deoxy-D-glucuronate isomerase
VSARTATQATGQVDVTRRGEAKSGYTPVLTPQNSPLLTLTTGRLRLELKDVPYKGETGEQEVLLHVLVGQFLLEVEGPWGKRSIPNVGERLDVFAGLPTTVVLGPQTSYKITPASRTVDIAIASVPIGNDEHRQPTVIRPQDVVVHSIGEKHFQRTVREVLGGEGPAVRMRAGETINPVGLWSSWPHHDFDANPDLAPQFEEVFLYFTKPKDGYGLQRREGLYSNLRPADDVIVVRNGDAAVMPLGDHPIVAGVDSSVLYVWFYVSPIAKLYAKWAEDLGGYA